MFVLRTGFNIRSASVAMLPRCGSERPSVTSRILIVEDDPILQEFIAIGLREQSYLVAGVTSLAGFMELASTEQFGLWILDRRFPNGDSLNPLRDLRASGLATPALVLTAMNEVDQRVEGFNAGADDYLTKPFSITELVVRVRALLRRGPALSPPILCSGPLQLHLDAGRVFSAGTEVIVTANEWRLLRLLVGRPGVAFSRSSIIRDVGIAEDAGEVAVDHLVSRLRIKLRTVGADKHLETIRGLGFSWRQAD